MTLKSINAEQRLYVMPCGNGYSCLGFDVAFRKAAAVAQWASLDAPDPAKIGTAEGYSEYERIMAAGALYAAQTKKRCPAELSPELVGFEGCHVEVVDEYDNKRRFWVGKSTGWMPCHLEIARRDSSGGFPAMGPFKSVRVVPRK